MLSAGLLGGPGIGFQQDYFATQKLEQTAPEAYNRYKAEKPNTFYGLYSTKGLNGSKVGILDLDKTIRDGDTEEQRQLAATDLPIIVEQTKLTSWWDMAKPYAPKDEKPIDEAGLFGGRMALKWTALVPATMAVLYLLLIVYFQTCGGYRKEHIEGFGTAAKEVD